MAIKLVKNTNGDKYRDFASYLRKLDGVYSDAVGQHMFTDKQIRRLESGAQEEYIHPDADMVVPMSFKKVKEFGDNLIMNPDAVEQYILPQLVENHFYYRGKNVENRTDNGAVEIFKKNLKEYFKNPTHLPKATLKKPVIVNPVKKVIPTVPRVYNLRKKDMFVQPNRDTYAAISALAEEVALLRKASIIPVIDNKNPTMTYADRLYVDWERVKKTYRETPFLIQRLDDSLRTTSLELVESFRQYRTLKATPLAAEVIHRKNIRRMTAVKGQIEKNSKKVDTILAALQLSGEKVEDRMVPTTPIAQPKQKTTPVK